MQVVWKLLDNSFTSVRGTNVYRTVHASEHILTAASRQGVNTESPSSYQIAVPHMKASVTDKPQ
jgi:hypothetical protein